MHDAYCNGPFAPVTKNPHHSVTSAQPGVKTPVLDAYADFQCPICDMFEKANGAGVQKLARQGQVRPGQIAGLNGGTTTTVKLNGTTVSIATLLQPGAVLEKQILTAR